MARPSVNINKSCIVKQTLRFPLDTRLRLGRLCLRCLPAQPACGQLVPACSHFVTLFCFAFALTSYNIRHHAPSQFVPFPFLGPSEPCLCSDLLGGRCWELLLTCRFFALTCGPGGLPGWAPPPWVVGWFPDSPLRGGFHSLHIMYVLACMSIHSTYKVSRSSLGKSVLDS